MNISFCSCLKRLVSVPEMIRSSTPFPLVSLFFMFIGFVLSNIGHIRPHHTILAFVSGIFFILSGILDSQTRWVWGPVSEASVWSRISLPGLSLVVGLVLYISNINDEMLNRTKSNEAYFSYKYGWSFAFAAISFLLTEVRPEQGQLDLWSFSLPDFTSPEVPGTSVKQDSFI